MTEPHDEGDPRDFVEDTEDEETLELPQETAFWADEGDGDSLTPQDALNLLEKQAALLVTVSTNREARPEDYNAIYKRGQRRLNKALRILAIPPPFPFDDLFEWHGRWSGGKLPTYESRRQHINDLAQPARDALEGSIAGVELFDPGTCEKATWGALDARIEAVAAKLRSARSRDDFEDVGRRCREILIGVAELVADPSIVPEGSEPPKKGDAKAWLELFLDSKSRGSNRKRFRALLRPSIELAQRVTHAGNDRVEAYAAAQATILVTRTLQQLS